MNQFINSMMSNNSKTYNDMPTHSESGSALLDLFFLIGATRDMSDNDILAVFSASFKEDRLNTMRVLFYARDIEKGLGERRVFRVISKYLVEYHGGNIFENLLQEKNIVDNIIRTDDLVWLANELVKQYGNAAIKEVKSIMGFLFQMMENEKVGGIVAKWMPRKKSQYSNLVKFMRENGMINTYSEYRHTIVSKTKVVEQQMSMNQWKEINLEHTPSIALKKYKKAFGRHEILKPFVDKVVAGEAKLHASKLFPYDIIRDIINKRMHGGYGDMDNSDSTQIKLLNEQWKGLAKLEDLPKEFKAIPVIDVSGSMFCSNNTPISVALGLGLYMAENNPNKAFRDYFITFSNSPAFQKIVGHDITEKVKNALRSDWRMNTNLEKVFDLVLKKAIENNTSFDDMPSHIIIFSDMEFDQCVKNADNNAMQMIKRMYREAGYDLPTVVFWNVQGRIGNVPVRKNDKGVLLVSGASQNVINFVLSKQYENLISIVYEVTGKDRYSHIKA